MYQYDEKNICDEKNNYPFILLEEETFDILYFCIVVNFFRMSQFLLGKKKTVEEFEELPVFHFIR